MKYYLQLMRPANLITAIADIMAGLSIAKFVFSTDALSLQTILLLSLSTVGLYGGGVVFNDVFDAELDAIERPERAIPSGKVSKQNATLLGSILLILGVFCAFLVSFNSMVIAIVVAILALVYDKFGKHHAFLGPINMGLCRGGNLLLGMSVIMSSFQDWWWIGIFPVLYIAAITMISRGEVHGGSKSILYFAGFLYSIVSISQIALSYQFGNVLITLPFVLLHIYLIFKPLFTAIQNPIGANIGKAVKAGVLALIVMDAAWVSVSGNYLVAIMVLLLLPLSIKIAKLFAVT
ncbi:4-hydroxybenzoate polyprenyltransferase [Arcicella aurantiaca]|uniref:4-hydroxybenzoate polyprenyltransferase n=1 Tax=Arcicella aurantiaca TaxID=591202 RepID=A0A316EQ98_9BACT|nr:UbiA-like protein EboC [Arcicella aurantiaca]PWK25220.1 4-hydroxybenzoate polyprenyltransferase [Arcicella aurantiaca]